MDTSLPVQWFSIEESLKNEEVLRFIFIFKEIAFFNLYIYRGLQFDPPHDNQFRPSQNLFYEAKLAFKLKN